MKASGARLGRVCGVTPTQGPGQVCRLQTPGEYVWLISCVGAWVGWRNLRCAPRQNRKFSQGTLLVLSYSLLLLLLQLLVVMPSCLCLSGIWFLPTGVLRLRNPGTWRPHQLLQHVLNTRHSSQRDTMSFFVFLLAFLQRSYKPPTTGINVCSSQISIW